MADRYPAHIPAALAQVLGMPPYQLHPIWMALREVGVDVPNRYEGEVAAALQFLIPHALVSGSDWRLAAGNELMELKAGRAFVPATLAIIPNSTNPRPDPLSIEAALRAAIMALRSYQFGNTATAIAADTADAGDDALRAAGLPPATLGASL